MVGNGTEAARPMGIIGRGERTEGVVVGERMEGGVVGERMEAMRTVTWWAVLLPMLSPERNTQSYDATHLRAVHPSWIEEQSRRGAGSLGPRGME